MQTNRPSALPPLALTLARCARSGLWLLVGLLVLGACQAQETRPPAAAPTAPPATALLIRPGTTAAGPSADPPGLADPATNPAAAPTLTPPLEPAAALRQALDQRAIGAYSGAAQTLNTLLNQPAGPESDPATLRQARYYLAESFALRGRWSSAAAALQNFLNEEPGAVQDDYTARALFWLARSYESLGDWQSAVATYTQYRALATPLEPYAALRQAAQYAALGQPAEAARAYAHAAAAAIDRGQRARSYEELIALQRQAGQEHAALETYRTLLDLASMPGYRARLLVEAATLAEALGEPDQASAWLLAAVDSAPGTVSARQAVERLRAAGNPALDPADGALVLFGAEAYAAALPLFDEAIARAPADSDTARDLQRLRALTRRELGDFAAALEQLAQVATADPTSQAGRQARLDWIQTLGQSGEPAQAARLYVEYARANGDDWRAPIALDRAAQLFDRVGDRAAATQTRLELGTTYPTSDLAAPALARAAWHHYDAGEFGAAQAAWQQLANTHQGYERARGAFWAGRIARQHNDHQLTQVLFGMAHAAAPNSYYGTRAAEELGLPFNGTVPPGTPLSDADWENLARWVAAWSAAPETSTSTASPSDHAATLAEVASSGSVQRAVALAQVGLESEAVAEWNSARAEWNSDPPRLLALARLAHTHAVPYIALKTAEEIVALAPPEAGPPPEALERLIFPTPYAALVLAEARSQGVDPLLFYSLMRQESLFRPRATSWVGARGLAQVMPETGTGIAQSLGVDDFSIDDLYRPVVSVRFGTYYLGQRIGDMEGSMHGGLAAYNGGLGNAWRWAGGSAVADPDLFAETIDFAETRGYVKLVYGFYGAYRRLYAAP